MSSYARGSDRDLSYIKEVTAGVTPATPVMKALRNTGDSFNLTRDSFVSAELRSDRAMTDLKLGNKQASGDIQFELSYTNFDDMLEAVLYSLETFAVDGTIKNGKKQQTFTIEKGFPDSTHFQQFKGMTPNSLTLTINANAQVTGTVSFIGMDQTITTTTIASSVTPAIAGGLFDSFNGSITEGGVSADITSLTITIDNGVEPVFVLMNNGAKALIDGRCNITGTLNVLFDKTLYAKFSNETESSLEFTLTTVEQPLNGYTFTLPRIKFTGADMPVNSEGVVGVTMPFQALQSEVTSSTIEIEKLSV